MATPEEYSIAQAPITAHSFSADRTEVCLSLNSNEAQILRKQGAEWKTIETLAEHDKVITSIDWAPNSNRIVTASQDRNAYVWTQSPDPQTGHMIWKPTLVLLRINRAATFVRWSPNEDKFAVASGARAIAICSFDPESDWWVSRQLKKPIRSTVLSVDWHPNNVLLAAGSADMKARVFSAYIKDVDTKPQPSVWGEKLPFNTLCGEYGSPSGGWVHGVGFSPSGDVLAFVSHDSSITIVYPGEQAIYNIKQTTLPLVSLCWTTEDALVAAGHDCQPILFQGSSAGWKAIGSLDDTTAPKSSGVGRASPVGRLNSAAFNTFRNADMRGQTSAPGLPGGGGSGDSELLTVHQNTITSVRPYDGAPGAVSRVSTSGVDGKIVIWQVAAAGGGLTTRMGALRV
ncbi:actin ARPC3 [Pyrrhoderma noxium]|uniref:Actin-related protein 2/3 complex subunit n=1 Tax=Pyrrhoderma noxium TaxID=2282107 RepID=A0A286UWJ6_9AGAM|nr:actin ARPC3 [Pyrrhoderma noxium]